MSSSFPVVPFGPIAIVGMAGRFPDAPTLEDFWANLATGRESLREFSDAEMRACGVDPKIIADPHYVKRGTILDDAEMFDASFFGLTRREAEAIDPQHRVLLEVAWHALEDAGYAGDPAALRTGVFAGASMNTYIFSNLLANAAACAAVGPYQIMLASDKDYLATRIAYKMDLRGPCQTVQTACSTSLVAVQLACENLNAGRCDMALAGGVSLTFPLRTGYLFTEGMILSKDGRCRPFDAAAGGTRPGAGAGLVVLRRLADALRDGDHIRAVIRGAASNNDGARKIGYTAPSIEGQSEVIRSAQALAGVAPETISYVEAHGTATTLGDPIELTALSNVFSGVEQGACALGALKSNIGHLDAAAGVAGLIKTVLALEHRQIPPTLHYKTPNPQFDLDASPFSVKTALTNWNANGTPRRAGVSSFGIGGTNAHVVVEEAPSQPAPSTPRSTHLLTLSARSDQTLTQAADDLAGWLERHEAVDLAAVAYTLHVGRKRFAHRLAVAATSPSEAAARLRQSGRTRSAADADQPASPVAFMFTGQGSQYVGMARDLMACEPGFVEPFERCLEILRGVLGHDLREVLYPADGSNDAATRLTQTALAQPALFALEYSLAQMWMRWGVRPHSMIGHSLGEYVAACVAGVFSLEDALRIVTERARIMQSMPTGAMLSIGLSADAVARLDLGVAIAAANAPNLTAVSGTEARIAALERRLLARDISCQRLRTSHAFHSEMMEPAMEPLAQMLRSIQLREPQIPYVSNLTGTWIRPDEATNPDYWTTHLRQTVRFAEGLQTLAAHGSPVMLEIGPGDTMCSLARQTVRTAARDVVPSLPGPRGTEGDASTVTQALGRLWIAGAPIDWSAVHERDQVTRVPLPLYPFERQKYWIEPKPLVSQQAVQRLDPDNWFYVPAWTRTTLPSRRGAGDAGDRAWIVFSPAGIVGDAIDRELAARGQQVWTVCAGSRFQRHGERAFEIDPSAADHYDEVIRTIADGNAPALTVVYAWTATSADDPGSEATAFYSPLLLAQALADALLPADTSIAFISTGLHAVQPGDRVLPHKALLLGPATVAAQELPHIQGTAIDLPLQPDHCDITLMVEALMDPDAWPSDGRRLAYRDGHRWEETWVQARPPRESQLRLRDGGVYLITGGTGGIGLTLAAYLAERVRARIALTTRRALPPRDEWPALAQQADMSEGGHLAASLLALEAAGAEVFTVTCDVATAEGMALALDATRERFGTLHGVIHAAGMAGAGLIQLKTPETAAAVLAPKVAGTLALSEIVRAGTLDFVVLCSSINAILGGPGSVDYTAANAFMDAFAQSHAHPTTDVIAINWDTWADVGMAARVSAAATGPVRLDTSHGIRPAEGPAAFQRALAMGQQRVAVITRSLPQLMDLASRMHQDARAFARKGLQELRVTPAQPGDAAPERGDALTVTEQRVVEIWKELLGVDTISLDDDFFSLGGHSLLATGVLSRVRQWCGAQPTLRSLFEASTVRAFAAHVDTMRAPGDARAVVDEPDVEREEIEL